MVRSLSEHLPDREIRGVRVEYEPLIAHPELDEFKRLVAGKRITTLKRRGKYILIKLEPFWLVVHLRMTGRLLFLPASSKVEKHTNLIFFLDQDYHLRFVNPRKFGRIYLLCEEELDRVSGMYKLGPEPLAPEYDLDAFLESFKGRRANIKSLLLNQSFLAGLGNIYSDEALFLAGLDPHRKADSLSLQEKERLYYAIKDVLQEGIKYRGTTISDYLDGEGRGGSFQERLKVYGREGESCLRCNQQLLKEKIAGRGSCYCPDCQL